ncbi:3',5'-cyclic-AMP phosphodiesterase [Aeromonas simiae]|uniref:3',5'-cyclic-AMP phosphodiesterase n=1 Tax=Aeromonas simiae TaxID=218936 RepID=UPI0005A87E2D|nr:3',5'-cyclic-AMP phosphodiesterase [Aeromonas simiae]MDO2949476.1 3',5'-cyclic-AMP phosphodiesterase [Aeromonas simiae]MDO2953140.1 3',5'-cyclic-AMP phosphodiesterase [Aeromonas simiae]MDO2956807.1 3',5'-cyclic-AMP phosphodiesterase [Aeromonas simiae]
METELPQAPDGCVRLLQITDTHLFANAEAQLLGVRTADSLAAVIERIQGNDHPFDLILATGDLSQDHSAESYQRFADMLAPLGKPIYWLPGNHDDGALMTQSLYEAGISEQKWMIGKHWQIILLDTQVRGKPHGLLADHQLAALDHVLRSHPDKHTLIALHHQGIPVGCAWLDQHNLKNADDLFAVLARHPQGKTLLFGHVHQEFDELHKGVRLIASPSTCIQFKPLCDEFTLDESGPGWRYLTLHPDGRVESQVWRLPPNSFIPDPTARGY